MMILTDIIDNNLDIQVKKMLHIVVISAIGFRKAQQTNETPLCVCDGISKDD